MHAHPIPGFEWLGAQAYEPTWHRLQAKATAVATGTSDEIIWSCEHEPVYTTGRRAVDNRAQPTLPAPLIHTDRGGETTFHGTGQIMLYPIIHLRKRHITAKQYVHLLEQSAIDLLGGLGIETDRRCGLPGVWTKEGKIAAIGLRIHNGVAYHGMALNVDVAAHWFDVINPCGTGKKSVSMTRYIGKTPELEALAGLWRSHLTSLLQQN
jgi:lipoyl(octanoyl) transferase